MRAGGRRVGDALLRRYVYEVHADDQSRWIHLRETGLTVKEIAHDGIDGTTETKVVVGDFETTNKLLGRIGFEPKSYHVNRRVSFELGRTRLAATSDSRRSRQLSRSPWPRLAMTPVTLAATLLEERAGDRGCHGRL
jgi:hypothetical protein